MQQQRSKELLLGPTATSVFDSVTQPCQLAICGKQLLALHMHPSSVHAWCFACWCVLRCVCVFTCGLRAAEAKQTCKKHPPSREAAALHCACVWCRRSTAAAERGCITPLGSWCVCVLWKLVFPLFSFLKQQCSWSAGRQHLSCVLEGQHTCTE